MLDKRLLWTGIGIFVVAAVAVVAARLPSGTREAQDAQVLTNAPGVRQVQESEPESAPRAWMYVIREHEGRVAVFGQNPDKPEIVFDKLVKYLPEFDRVQLKAGIEIYSYEELTARIEDYIS